MTNTDTIIQIIIEYADSSKVSLQDAIVCVLYLLTKEKGGENGNL